MFRVDAIRETSPWDGMKLANRARAEPARGRASVQLPESASVQLPESASVQLPESASVQLPESASVQLPESTAVRERPREARRAQRVSPLADRRAHPARAETANGPLQPSNAAAAGRC